MDDESKQLLREIRDRLDRSESRRLVFYCVLLIFALAMTFIAVFRVGQERERDRREAVRSWPRAVGERPSPE